MLFLAHLLTGMSQQPSIQRLCGPDRAWISKAACHCFRPSASPGRQCQPIRPPHEAAGPM